MPNVKAVSDIGAVAEAVNQGLRLIRDLIDPDKTSKRDSRKRIRNFIKARNEAAKAFKISDEIMRKYKETDPKQYAKYLNIRDDFDKAKRRT